ncbi:kunitz-type protease inhibitor 2-like [Eptesicus fuscus]|uniref:kunitz-type protease inhibitor 2-like n=1 Tax=Eptesicus fuscus TaxID=29078 RepID=UPI00240424FA|nr:kunitz-type protease inhibitor 2-like [Eptesicus fuscus]
MALLALLASLLLFGAKAANEERDIHDFCRVPKVVGRCLASLHRWWYNATCRSCQQFVYGGCGRNGNNYLTKEQCLEKCADIPGNTMDNAATSRNPADSSGPSVPRRQGFDGPSSDIFNYKEYCAARVATGPCHASLPRWYFDAKNNSCDRFIYGGCWGNRNNYLSQEACMSSCLGPWSYPAPPHSITKDLAELFEVILLLLVCYGLLYLVVMGWVEFDLTFCSSKDDEDPLLMKKTWRRGGQRAAESPYAV